jgi:hypothetical protein
MSERGTNQQIGERKESCLNGSASETTLRVSISTLRPSIQPNYAKGHRAKLVGVTAMCAAQFRASLGPNRVDTVEKVLVNIDES